MPELVPLIEIRTPIHNCCASVTISARTRTFARWPCTWTKPPRVALPTARRGVSYWTTQRGGGLMPPWSSAWIAVGARPKRR